MVKWGGGAGLCFPGFTCGGGDANPSGLLLRIQAGAGGSGGQGSQECMKQVHEAWTGFKMHVLARIGLMC